MARIARYLWPRSLYGQIVLAVALALFVAQAINAAMLMASLRNRAITESATMLVGRVSNYVDRQGDQRSNTSFQGMKRNRRSPAIAIVETPVPLAITGFDRQSDVEDRAREFLNRADTGITEIRFSVGPLRNLPPNLSSGPLHRPFIKRLKKAGRNLPPDAMLLSVLTADGRWINAANVVRPRDLGSILAMILQTILIYVAVMIPLALIARRIAKPLARLTKRVEQVGLSDHRAPLVSEGPSDVRHLIDAFNGMQARVTGLLSEKDVMLGAIGHDLKTPLAALRVRVESVENDQDREKMAGTIDEMVIILDDILTLARLGKSGEALQLTDIGALVETVCGEFEETGADIALSPPASRLVAPIRPVLVRRLLRNMIGNALQHGNRAAVSVEQTSKTIKIVIDDEGPGIPPDQIEQMFEAFVRAEGSRNRETGGSGLGLTIARAIARGHGGELTLTNRIEGGLRAVVELSAG